MAASMRSAVSAEHRFLRDENEAVPADTDTDRTARKLAIEQEQALFKDFGVADLREARQGRSGIGLRWRTRGEVLRGKGSKICGALDCESTHGLRSYEVDFRYHEAGDGKRTLVKVRLCKKCARDVGWRKKHHHRHHHHHHHHKRKKPPKKRRREEEEQPAEEAKADETPTNKSSTD